MSTEALLWAALGATAAVYYGVGRGIVARPRWDLPRIFWHRGIVALAVFFPLAGFVSVIVAGFALTYTGWRYLVGAVAIFFFFAVRPRIMM
jgi:hypothetical protein